MSQTYRNSTLKTSFIVFILLTGVGSLVSCNDNDEKTSANVKKEVAIANVNGKVISENSFNAYLKFKRLNTGSVP